MDVVFAPPQTTDAAVKEAIADLEECRPAHLGTLDEAVDTDALNALNAVASADSSEDVQTVTFQYCGYSITADSSRTLHIDV